MKKPTTSHYLNLGVSCITESFRSRPLVTVRWMHLPCLTTMLMLQSTIHFKVGLIVPYNGNILMCQNTLMLIQIFSTCKHAF